MLTAVLDACVLWPSLQRDLLLSLAAERAFRPLWSSAILDELRYHEAEKLTRHGWERKDADAVAAHLIARMSLAFDDATVTGWEALEGSFGLPDPDDEHVVAAVIGRAEVIITANLKDFPAARLPPGLHAISPAQFVHDTVRQDLAAASRAVMEICRRSGRHGPPLTPATLLEALESRYAMHDAVSVLRGARGIRDLLH